MPEHTSKTFLTKDSPKPGARQELPGEGPVVAVAEAKENFGRENFVRATHEGDMGRPTENMALDNVNDKDKWVLNSEIDDAFARNAETVAAIKGANPDYNKKQIYNMLVNMGKV